MIFEYHPYNSDGYKYESYKNDESSGLHDALIWLRFKSLIREAPLDHFTFAINE